MEKVKWGKYNKGELRNPRGGERELPWGWEEVEGAPYRNFYEKTQD